MLLGPLVLLPAALRRPTTMLPTQPSYTGAFVLIRIHSTEVPRPTLQIPARRRVRTRPLVYLLSPTSSYQDPVRSGYQSPAASSSGASSTHLSPRRPNDYDRNGATTRTSSGVPSRHDSPGGATDPRLPNAGPPRGANSRAPYDGAFPTNPQDPRRGSNPFPQSNAPRYDPKKHHSDGWAANTDRKR